MIADHIDGSTAHTSNLAVINCIWTQSIIQVSQRNERIRPRSTSLLLLLANGLIFGVKFVRISLSDLSRTIYITEVQLLQEQSSFIGCSHCKSKSKHYLHMAMDRRGGRTDDCNASITIGSIFINGNTAQAEGSAWCACNCLAHIDCCNQNNPWWQAEMQNPNSGSQESNDRVVPLESSLLNSAESFDWSALAMNFLSLENLRATSMG